MDVGSMILVSVRLGWIVVAELSFVEVKVFVNKDVDLVSVVDVVNANSRDKGGDGVEG